MSWNCNVQNKQDRVQKAWAMETRGLNHAINALLISVIIKLNKKLMYDNIMFL